MRLRVGIRKAGESEVDYIKREIEDQVSALKDALTKEGFACLCGIVSDCSRLGRLLGGYEMLRRLKPAGRKLEHWHTCKRAIDRLLEENKEIMRELDAGEEEGWIR